MRGLRSLLRGVTNMIIENGVYLLPSGEGIKPLSWLFLTKSNSWYCRVYIEIEKYFYKKMASSSRKKLTSLKICSITYTYAKCKWSHGITYFYTKIGPNEIACGFKCKLVFYSNEREIKYIYILTGANKLIYKD